MAHEEELLQVQWDAKEEG